MPRDSSSGALHRLSDQEILAIARRLLVEVHASPPDDPRDETSSPRRALSPADEARVESALVQLGAVTPANTSREE